MGGERGLRHTRETALRGRHISRPFGTYPFQMYGTRIEMPGYFRGVPLGPLGGGVGF